MKTTKNCRLSHVALLVLLLSVGLLSSCGGEASRPISDETSATVACEMFAQRQLLGASGLTFAPSSTASVGKDERGKWVTRIYAERKDGGAL